MKGCPRRLPKLVSSTEHLDRVYFFIITQCFAHAVRRFAALAFLPATEIVEGLLDITMCLDESEDSKCENGCVAKEVPESFCQYFEANYIGILQGRGKHQKRRTPRFPPSFWSVYDWLRANLRRYGH